jgi:hypothetical protein
MSTRYRLVNPIIKGEIDTLYSGNDALEAANDAFVNISKYFSNSTPDFIFSLQRLKDNKLFHFNVNENRDENIVNYKVSYHNVDLDKSKQSSFLNKIEEVYNSESLPGLKDIQSGGKKHRKYDDSSSDDSSDSSDSSDSVFKYKKYKHKFQQYPIYYYWYDPSIYDIKNFYVPSFVNPLSPYVLITYNF